MLHFTPKNWHRICSKHFEEIWFYHTPTGKVKLLDKAVPTLFKELPKSVQPAIPTPGKIRAQVRLAIFEIATIV